MASPEKVGQGDGQPVRESFNAPERRSGMPALVSAQLARGHAGPLGQFLLGQSPRLAQLRQPDSDIHNRLLSEEEKQDAGIISATNRLVNFFLTT
jgi:hypothetical protein